MLLPYMGILWPYLDISGQTGVYAIEIDANRGIRY
jgi:hypothetical protein